MWTGGDGGPLPWGQEPVEITVGGRSSACRDVAQFVELFDGEEGKFLRLLQVLGEWVTKGLILVFVDTQAECDDLYQAHAPVDSP